MFFKVKPLTEAELEAVTIVFHQYETGLREGTIYTRVSNSIDTGLKEKESGINHCKGEIYEEKKSLGDSSEQFLNLECKYKISFDKYELRETTVLCDLAGILLQSTAL